MTKLPITLLVSAIGIALLAASPAEAAKRKHHSAAAPKQYMQAAEAPQRSQSVYYGDKYLGSDPDPRIRYELRRDLGAAFGGDN
jgi:hypothetical protein